MTLGMLPADVVVEKPNDTLEALNQRYDTLIYGNNFGEPIKGLISNEDEHTDADIEMGMLTPAVIIPLKSPISRELLHPIFNAKLISLICAIIALTDKGVTPENAQEKFDAFLANLNDNDNRLLFKRLSSYFFFYPSTRNPHFVVRSSKLGDLDNSRLLPAA